MKMTTNTDFTTIIEEIYMPCGLKVSNLVLEKESKEYEASTYQLNALKIKARRSKITPKKNWAIRYPLEKKYKWGHDALGRF